MCDTVLPSLWAADPISTYTISITFVWSNDSLNLSLIQFIRFTLYTHPCNYDYRNGNLEIDTLSKITHEIMMSDIWTLVMIWLGLFINIFIQLRYEKVYLTLIYTCARNLYNSELNRSWISSILPRTSFENKMVLLWRFCFEDCDNKYSVEICLRKSQIDSRF